jgi:hypothetical protein
MKLDDFMPHYHFNEVHRLRVRAQPEVVFQAVKTLSVSEMPKLVHGLMVLRGLPAKLLGTFHEPPASEKNGKMTFLEEMLSADFILLAETPGREVVLGLVGEFWRMAPRAVVQSSSEAFLRFEAPGYAKVAANLLVTAEKGGAWLQTETRILAMDKTSRRKFGRYWFVIALGSGLIRRLWLRAIKRKAETVQSW